MNRNTGVVKTFQTTFTRVQEGNPINFGYTRSNTVKEKKQSFTVTVKNDANVLSDAELFVQVVLQNLDKLRFASKLRLDHSYRVVKVNQNVTRYFVTGYFE